MNNRRDLLAPADSAESKRRTSAIDYLRPEAIAMSLDPICLATAAKSRVRRAGPSAALVLNIGTSTSWLAPSIGRRASSGQQAQDCRSGVMCGTAGRPYRANRYAGTNRDQHAASWNRPDNRFPRASEPTRPRSDPKAVSACLSTAMLSRSPKIDNVEARLT
jgi:hypothetical protein